MRSMYAGRHVNLINPYSLPLRGLENLDLKTGDTIILEIEATIHEPAQNGFNVMVHTVRTKGARFLSGDVLAEEDIRSDSER